MITSFLDVNILHPNDITTEEELFFLYGLISSMNPKTIVELGAGTTGIFSKLFVKAQKKNPDAKLYSIDVLDMNKNSENQILIKKNCDEVNSSDLHNRKIDVLFFDCHCVIPQLNFYNRMLSNNLINNDTVLILHDTNLLYEPASSQIINYAGQIGLHTKDGYAHQWVERNLVNYFKLKGYDVFNLSTKKENHNEEYPLLLGFSVCKKFVPLNPFHLVYPE